MTALAEMKPLWLTVSIEDGLHKITEVFGPVSVSSRPRTVGIPQTISPGFFCRVMRYSH